MIPFRVKKTIKQGMLSGVVVFLINRSQPRQVLRFSVRSRKQDGAKLEASNQKSTNVSFTLPGVPAPYCIATVFWHRTRLRFSISMSGRETWVLTAVHAGSSAGWGVPARLQTVAVCHPLTLTLFPFLYVLYGNEIMFQERFWTFLSFVFLRLF